MLPQVVDINLKKNGSDVERRGGEGEKGDGRPSHGEKKKRKMNRGVQLGNEKASLISGAQKGGGHGPGSGHFRKRKKKNPTITNARKKRGKSASIERHERKKSRIEGRKRSVNHEGGEKRIRPCQSAREKKRVAAIGEGGSTWREEVPKRLIF